MKKIALLATVTIITLCMNFSAFAGEWKQNSTGWWYQNDDGTNPSTIWKQINDNWYYFDSNGYVNTGWIKISNQWYYCEPTGEMRTNELSTDVFNFKFNSDGSCLNFYENTTPSVQAGWYSYGTSSLSTLTNAIASGDVIYYNSEYWATPDYVSTLKNQRTTYFHDVAPTEESSNRYWLSEI